MKLLLVFVFNEKQITDSEKNPIMPQHQKKYINLQFLKNFFHVFE
jgi:hypothetical protein